MSAEHPPHPETGPETSPTPEPSLDDVAARSAVPPTPETPQAEIAAVQERLHARPQRSPAPQPATRPLVGAAPAPKVTFTHRIVAAGDKVILGGKAIFGFFQGVFGYIGHMVWHMITHAGEMNTGGGGGGGHAKPKGGGGGGHH